ncbi:hypothetical protein ACF068_30745 [Streptomyces sp. NPDC016309]|uniref:hypothetical protein n=1 Tax=Streptomyces sp. NPDC016309 TaxID=3364965 RepID=UPI003700A69F
MSLEERTEQQSNNLGKWDDWYRDLSLAAGPGLYSEPTTYLIAAAFLADVDEVEDWGCGRGGFRRFNVSGGYKGIDGSRTPFADEVEDLRAYRSASPGILMRHVIEHNYDWEKVLTGAVESFRKKFCLVLFTPFTEKTCEIAHNRELGVDVPDLSFAREDIERHFAGLRWKLMANLPSSAQYGVEHVYLVWRA